MPKHPTAPPLYPDLEDGQNYRLQKISELEQRLIRERDTRISLYKKYKRGINVIDGIDTALIAGGIAIGGTGIGLLSTIIAAPIVVPLEITAIVCGLIGVSLKFVNRRLQFKAKKHNEIRILAESKLNSMKDLISRALHDGQITEQEFKLILDDFEKYNTMKQEIRDKKAEITDKQKKDLIQQGKTEAMETLQKKLKNV